MGIIHLREQEKKLALVNVWNVQALFAVVFAVSVQSRWTTLMVGFKCLIAHANNEDKD